MNYSYNSLFRRMLQKNVQKLIIEEDIEIIDDNKFNSIALDIFTYQFYNNELYRKYCEKKYGVNNPRVIDNYLDIPAVPADAFKVYKTKLISFPQEITPRATVFKTSRTTSNEKGEIMRDPDTVSLYNLALEKSTKEFVFPDVKKMKIYLLAYNPGTEFIIGNKFGDQVVYVTYHMVYHKFSEEVFEALKKDEKDRVPVAVFSPTIVLLNFLKHCQDSNIQFSLAKGSRIVSGGGYRSFMKHPPLKSEILELEERVLGIPQSHILDVYSSNEKPSLIYDNSLRNVIFGRSESRYKLNLPWTRTLIIDPAKYSEKTILVNNGEEGLIKQYDLADIGSIMVIYMGDAGIKKEKGFEIIGGAEGNFLNQYRLSSNDFYSIVGQLF